MDKNPKISIITICYNSKRTIENTIKSIVSQSYVNREYIIVDGGSTDGTLSVIDRYRDSVDVVVSEPDNGISDAFNKGIRLATGEVVVLINADDLLLPEALVKVADAWTEDTDLLMTNVIMKDSLTGFECREVPSTDFPLMPFFRHVAHQGAYVSKACYERYGLYDTEIRWPMDLEFMVRASVSGARFRYADIDTAVFMSGGTTNSNGIMKKRRDYIRLVRKNGGSMLQAWCFFLFLVMTQTVKKIMSPLGRNFAQKLRYGKK